MLYKKRKISEFNTLIEKQQYLPHKKSIKIDENCIITVEEPKIKMESFKFV